MQTMHVIKLRTTKTEKNILSCLEKNKVTEQ